MWPLLCRHYAIMRFIGSCRMTLMLDFSKRTYVALQPFKARTSLTSTQLRFLVTNLSNEQHLETDACPSWVKTDTDKAIYYAKSPEELLNLCDNVSNFSAGQLGSILYMLNQFSLTQKTDCDLITSHENFKLLCTVMTKKMQSIPLETVVSSLKHLLLLGVSSNSTAIKRFETEIIRRLSRMSLSKILSIAHFMQDYLFTAQDRMLYNESLKALLLRWVEINSTNDIMNLLALNDLSTDLLSRIEEKCLQLTDKMTVDELHKVICVLGSKRRRNTPLLKSISYHLASGVVGSKKLSAKQMINIFYHFSQLSFYDSELLHLLSNDLMLQISTETIKQPFLISSLLVSLGQLQWRNTQLLDLLGEIITDKWDICRAKELAAYVLTLARLNYSGDEKLLSRIAENLSMSAVQNKRDVWLDLVWSLVILQKATVRHISSVLEPSFYEHLLSEKLVKPTTHHKLRVIDAAADAELEGYSGPRLNDRISLEKLKPAVNKTKQMLAKSVVDVANNFAPKGRFMKVGVYSSFGCYIDAELVVDRACRPLPLKTLTEGTLPDKARRVAILVWDFFDFTQCSVILTGDNAVTVRLLEKNGYSVVQVPHTSLKEDSSLIDKLKYLQKAIEDATDCKPS